MNKEAYLEGYMQKKALLPLALPAIGMAGTAATWLMNAMALYFGGKAAYHGVKNVGNAVSEFHNGDSKKGWKALGGAGINALEVGTAGIFGGGHALKGLGKLFGRFANNSKAAASLRGLAKRMTPAETRGFVHDTSSMLNVPTQGNLHGALRPVENVIDYAGRPLANAAANVLERKFMPAAIPGAARAEKALNWAGDKINIPGEWATNQLAKVVGKTYAPHVGMAAALGVPMAAGMYGITGEAEEDPGQYAQQQLQQRQQRARMRAEPSIEG